MFSFDLKQSNCFFFLNLSNNHKKCINYQFKRNNFTDLLSKENFNYKHYKLNTNLSIISASNSNNLLLNKNENENYVLNNKIKFNIKLLKYSINRTKCLSKNFNVNNIDDNLPFLSFLKNATLAKLVPKKINYLIIKKLNKFKNKLFNNNKESKCKTIKLKNELCKKNLFLNINNY